MRLQGHSHSIFLGKAKSVNISDNLGCPAPVVTPLFIEISL